MIALLLAASAWASAPGCAPLTEAHLTESIDAAREALFAEDIPAHVLVMTRLEARIECFEFVPRPEQWSELLVGMAIVNYATGGDWETPLTTALRVHPRVDRLVGAQHEIASWQPPTPLPPGRAVPEGVRVYYDGELVTQVPAPNGLHLVQRRTGDGLSTRLLLNEPIPTAWLEVPELLSARDPGWVYFGVLGGARARGQHPSDPGAFVTEWSSTRIAAGASIDGVLRVGGPAGVRFDLAVPDLVHEAAVDGSLGGALLLDDLTVSLGVGLRTLSLTTAHAVERFWLVHPRAGVTWRSPDRSLLLGADAGWTPSITALHGRAAWALAGEGTRPFFGIDARMGAGKFRQDGHASRGIPVHDVTVMAEVGLAWWRSE